MPAFSLENILTSVILLGLLLGGGFGIYKVAVDGGRLNNFTQCLADEEAVFYGAFWCPHCQATKALFGASQRFLPYVECSTPDGQGQLPVCSEKNVTGYPTWEFKDGSRLNGEVTLEELAEKTSCELPE